MKTLLPCCHHHHKEQGDAKKLKEHWNIGTFAILILIPVFTLSLVTKTPRRRRRKRGKISFLSIIRYKT